MKYLKPAAVALAVCLFAARVEAVPGDINKDGIVNLVDFFILADNFGQEGQAVDACNSGQDVMSGVIDIGSGDSSPNVLLIIADDLGVDATPGYPVGAEKARMPTLTGLQAEGVIFDNFWAYPVCAPTRATILTGRHGIRTGVLSVGGDSPGIGLGELSIQRLLSESTSYSNAVVGKWHLSDASNGGADNPNLMGVSHYIGLLAGAHQDYRIMRYVENG